MATLIYADTPAYETWSGAAAPDNIAVLLRHASIIVRRATRNDLYDVDSAGKPSDPVVAEAFAEATCAQAHGWAIGDLDPAAGVGGQEPRLMVSAIDGASASYDTYLTADARAAALETLNAAALAILRNAGLASAAACG